MTQEKKESTKIVTPKEKEEQELARSRRFYELLKIGAFFNSFVYKDLEKVMNQDMDRVTRKRIEKAMKKGKYTKEMVDHYSKQIDKILIFITQEEKKCKEKYEKLANGEQV